MVDEAEVRVVEGRASRIKVPRNISEQSGITGFVFSETLLEAARIAKLTVSPVVCRGRSAFQYSGLARRLASDSGGGPAVGENSVTMWINGAHTHAGSGVNYIWIYFGSNKRIKLLGVDGSRFPKGWTLTWNLNDVSSYLESIPTDAWDDITLVTDSTDGIKMDRLRIKHSSVTIMDWNCNTWLDGSKMETHSKVGLSAKIMNKKLGLTGNRWIPQIHWATRELGKTRGKKYGTSGAWCSEFASWCLRKALWDTPTGSIGSSKMEKFFNDRGRKYTKNQVLNGDYVLQTGDYVRFEWPGGGQHSALFVRYVDSSSNPTDDTRFQTIEGNVGAAVNIATRTFADVLSVGNTR